MFLRCVYNVPTQGIYSSKAQFGASVCHRIVCFLIQITWMVSIYVILAIRYLDHVTEIFSMYFGKFKMSLIWELGWPYSICHHSSFFFSLVHLLGISEGMKHFLLVVVLHL